jgi:type VI secretion system ImpA/VasJ family protein
VPRDLTAELETYLVPCAGEPAGADARYDPLHESIRNRVAALDAPTGGEVDWDAVVTDARTMLGASEDRVIASFLAFGLYERRGVEGLTVGLRVLAELMDRFWEGAHPPLRRLRARSNAIDWITERTVPRIAGTPVGPADHDLVDELTAAAARLSEVVGARFEDSAPAMRPLLDATKRLQLSLPPRPAGPAAPPAAPPGEMTTPAEAVSDATTPSAAAAPVATTPVEAPAEASPPTEADPLAPVRAKLALMVRPISDAQPAGDDARYDPLHESVRNEVAKLDMPTAGEIDWSTVTRDCEILLRTKSKDILIASYWAGARAASADLEGVTEGLLLLAQIMDGFWEDAQPPKRRERARGNAVDWFLGRLTTLSDRTLTAADAPRIAALELAAKELARVARERFEERLPPTRPLVEQIERMKLSVPKPAPPKVEPPKPPTATAPTTPSAPSAPTQSAPATIAAPGNAEDVDNFLRQTATAVQQSARTLFKASPQDPTSYRLFRVALYLAIRQPPPSPDGKKTAVPPPPDKIQQQLETLLGNSNWSALLEEAESALVQFRFWVDLHRYVSIALGNLGHTDAKREVVGGARALLERMPMLLDASFANGLAFCSPTCRAWVDSDVLASGGGGGGGGPAGDPKLAEARKKAIGGARDEAVALLEELTRTGADGRTRFEAALTIAELVSTNAPAVADGLCTALGEDAERHRLDQWDPTLAARLYTTHLGALGALPKDPNKAPTERRALVYARLCRVAPGAALKLK